jgi:tetratricopeptide (TPR) repeat protein
MAALTAGRTRRSTALIGRTEEMALLGRKLDEAAQGQGAVVILSGEAGLGKTRLIQEVELKVRQRQMAFLCGAGDSQGADLPYGLLTGVLRAYLRQASPAQVEALAEAVSLLVPHLWQRLFPDQPPPAAPAVDIAPDLRQSLFLGRLGKLLQELSGKRPVVVCLEDLHWADSASLQALHFLSRRSAEYSLLILGTCRPEPRREEGGISLQGVLQDLHRHRHFYLLELAPLSPEDTSALVESCLEQEGGGQRMTEKLYQKSGGVPLFIVYYLESLREKGLLRQEHLLGDDLAEGLQMPDSLQQVLQQRLQHLSAEARLLLGHAAVQGDTFEGRLVARALGWPTNQTLRLLAKLCRQTRLVQSEDQGFRFSHPLLAEVFYGFLPQAQRVQGHLHLADLLEKRRPQDAETLAHHLYRAGALERALPHLLEAARRARQVFAYREARRFLTQAEEALTALESAALRPQHLEILLARAEIEGRSGDPPTALALCREALLLSVPGEDGPARFQALLQMGEVQARYGNGEEAARLYQDTLTLAADLGDEQKTAVASVRLGNLAFERSQMEQAEEYFKNAKDAAVVNANQPLLGAIHGNLGVLASVRGQYVEAILAYTEALKAYRRDGHTYGICQTYHNLGMAHAAHKQWEVALECYARAEKLAREMGTADVLANILVSQAPAQINAGDLEAAHRSCQQARAYMDQLGDVLGQAECLKVEGMIRAARSQHAQAEECLQEGRLLFQRLKNQLGAAECDLELGRLLGERGDLERAHCFLERAQRAFREIGAEADARRAEESLRVLVP